MKLLTIPKTAKEIGIAEFRLRRLQKEGKCPGVYAGTRYYVDVDRLLVQLDAECAANAQQSTDSEANV